MLITIVFLLLFEIHLNEIPLENFVQKLLHVFIDGGLPTIGAEVCTCACLLT